MKNGISEKVKVPEWTPPAWLNSMMKLMLKTPGLERWLGRQLALLTFTDRKTGQQYTTPVPTLARATR
jgi:hypothetical protein